MAKTAKAKTKQANEKRKTADLETHLPFIGTPLPQEKELAGSVRFALGATWFVV
jgi:hypothetical protein